MINLNSLIEPKLKLTARKRSCRLIRNTFFLYRQANNDDDDWYDKTKPNTIMNYGKQFASLMKRLELKQDMKNNAWEWQVQNLKVNYDDSNLHV